MAVAESFGCAVPKMGEALFVEVISMVDEKEYTEGAYLPFGSRHTSYPKSL